MRYDRFTLLLLLGLALGVWVAADTVARRGEERSPRAASAHGNAPGEGGTPLPSARADRRPSEVRRAEPPLSSKEASDAPRARGASDAASAATGARSSTAAACGPEVCDGVDNDCDGVVDEPGALGCGAAFPDRDGDGYGAGLGGCFCVPPEGSVSNALDCDDGRSDVHPHAAELCDGEVDNDCDGYSDLCGALPYRALVPGDLAIRRVQDHASGIDDSLAEWFEIENLSPWPFELMGLEVSDDGVDGFRIRRSLVLEPHARVVLGRNGDVETNGGVRVDYVYSDLILSNAGDSIELRSDGMVIDRVVYAEAGDLIPERDTP